MSSIFVFVAVMSTIAAFLLFVFVLYRKNFINSTYFPFLVFAVIFYLLGNFIEISATTEAIANVGLKIRFIGVPFIPTLWFLSIREFCGLQFQKKYTIWALLFVPLLITYLAITWQSNHLLFADASWSEGNNHGNLTMTPGPLLYFRLAYQYGINLLGLFTLAWQYRKGTRHFKTQVFLFLFSALIPVFNTTTYILDFNDQSVDVTPYALIVSILLFTYALHRFGVYNQASILRDNALDNINEGVLLFDQNGIFMDSNTAARNIFPQLEEVPLGTHIADMHYLPFNSATLDKRNPAPLSEFSYSSDGSLLTYGISMAPIRLRDQNVGHSVILNNISLLKKSLNELEAKSNRDALTGVYNRGYLFDTGEDWVKKSARSHEPFSVVMFDIDHFKKVNDTHGHVFGDYVLKEMAQICNIDLRQTDVLGRYGGEEFCILLFSTPLEGAICKAESIRVKIASHRFASDGISVEITASFGVAAYQKAEPEETFTDLIKRADANLYRAKSEGRNRVCA